jgi:hypothetical protein
MRSTTGGKKTRPAVEDKNTLLAVGSKDKYARLAGSKDMHSTAGGKKTCPAVGRSDMGPVADGGEQEVRAEEAGANSNILQF